MAKRHSARWFRAAVAAGFLLGLLVDTIYTFRYVVRHLVLGHVASEAGQLVSRLENEARVEGPTDPPALVKMLEAVRRERPDGVAWIRIADQEGWMLAASGGGSQEPVPRAALDAIITSRAQRTTVTRATPRGELLVVTLPFRDQFPEERAARALVGRRHAVAASHCHPRCGRF
jgi:hypothetical protein